MYFVVLATDYDGTLAEDGRVQAATLEAIEKVKHSGRKLILATGREMPDLERVFPELAIFDLIVAENGALLYDPASRTETPLAEPPPPAFVRRLEELGVTPLSVGRSIVATWEPNETIVLEAIRDLSLEHHIVFNKGAVMVLPPNINKATGVKAALDRLGLSLHNTVGIGDAENDHAFIVACGCGVATANAIQPLKDKADFLVAARGAGVVELAERLIATDLRSPGLAVPRRRPRLGVHSERGDLCLDPFATTLVTGSSGGGKSTTVGALMEQMRDLEFQFCVVDPEGDYAEFEGAAVVGDVKQEPRMSEVMSLLDKPGVSVVVNLLAIDPAERPPFFAGLLGELATLRTHTGRPHWIVVDEAHHCLPAKWQPAQLALPQDLPATIAVTVHPEEVAKPFLELVSTVISVGDGGLGVIDEFCEALGRTPPARPLAKPAEGQAYLLGADGTLTIFEPVKPSAKRKRHIRKYAEGELGDDKSFYFRGPKDALNLKAQNLSVFLQLAEGVDDDTWRHHLNAGHYSDWVRDSIKDEDLAELLREAETDESLSPAASRAQIKEAIESKYTAPAKTA